ncbi:uncharacterized protein LOC120356142 [Nilaparvata lugens]|uniref:uncharacterized protein LOC120356142 n=1 Tax=Nilaparvata lugens TaxID=108931 RepID=UPI00193E58F1|nr:uncharacterized protein LOC120356142 [Nilaparvata lugens]
MVTRAVHVEVVSELSTKAFIAALIRFSARRGIPFAIHSDNATTFVGAHNELNELHAFLSDSAIQSEIHNFAAVFNIGWHFIPPRAPHFGGLWENAVKNFKRIFRVVTLNTTRYGWSPFAPHQALSSGLFLALHRFHSTRNFLINSALLIRHNLIFFVLSYVSLLRPAGLKGPGLCQISHYALCSCPNLSR